MLYYFTENTLSGDYRIHFMMTESQYTKIWNYPDIITRDEMLEIIDSRVDKYHCEYSGEI